jgi:PAS domain S-box-containing protein
VKLSNQTIGVIHFSSFERTSFAEQELDFLLSLGNQIGTAIAKARIVEEMKKREEALLNSEERYRSLINNAPVCIHEIDLGGNLMSMNRAGLQMVGTENESQIRGLPYLNFVAQEDRERIGTLLTSAFEGKVSEFEFRSLGERLFASSFIPLKSAEGSILKLIGITQDITTRKQDEEVLQKARDELEMRIEERTAELENSRVQLRALTAHLQYIQEEEGKRIAREIHDELGQVLTGLNIELSELVSQISKLRNKTNRDSLLKKIQSMSNLLDNTLQALRRIITELRPGILDDLGLVPALEWQAQEFQERTGIKCDFSSENIDLDRERSTAIFRICQESLTNVARHANATRVNIGLKEDTDNVILEVTDNGRGVKEEEIQNSQSFGILGMRERALLFGGEINITGRQGQGTTVTVHIPINR